MEVLKVEAAKAFADQKKSYDKSISSFDAKQYYEQDGEDEIVEMSNRFREMGYILSPQQGRQLQQGRFAKPSFHVDKKTLESMGSFRRKIYNKKKARYVKARREWDESDEGKAWAKIVGGINAEARAKLALEYSEGIVKRYPDEFPRIEATVEAMDEAIKVNTECTERNLSQVVAGVDVKKLEKENEAHRIWEDQIRQAEYKRFSLLSPDAIYALERYMDRGGKSDVMNDHLRGFDRKDGLLWNKYADTLKEGLSKMRLSRDVVVRRGCSLEWLARTMGIEGISPQAGSLKGENYDRVEAEVTRLLSGDTSKLVLKEEGFTSTAMGMNSGLRANGVEVIILAKKGTHGMNVSDKGPTKTEQELLLGAGTKFRIVKAFFNRPGDRKEDKNEAFLGDPGTLKVYLETIPDRVL